MDSGYLCSTGLTSKTEEEQEKFLRLYKTYAPAMYHTAYVILKDSHLAEDVVQDCFEVLLQNLKKIHEEQVFRTKGYLLKITKNRACTVRKRRKRELPQEDILELLPSEIETPELLVIDEERKQNLLAQISHLKEQDRELLEWSYLYQMPTKEIAERLHISEAGVRKRLERAKKTLKKCLERDVAVWNL